MGGGVEILLLLVVGVLVFIALIKHSAERRLRDEERARFESYKEQFRAHERMINDWEREIQKQVRESSDKYLGGRG